MTATVVSMLCERCAQPRRNSMPQYPLHCIHCGMRLLNRRIRDVSEWVRIGAEFSTGGPAEGKTNDL